MHGGWILDEKPGASCAAFSNYIQAIEAKVKHLGIYPEKKGNLSCEISGDAV